MRVTYLDVFVIEDMDFMYWYLSTDGKNYIMQSLNIGENQCNDIYSLFGIDRKECYKAYDEELGNIFVYKKEFINDNMQDYMFKIRSYDLKYNDFYGIMDLYANGKRFPKR